MLKGYRRLPCKYGFLVRFTKQYKSGHIQLYNVWMPRDGVRYPNAFKINNTLLGEPATEKIEKEIKAFIKSFNFHLKEYCEMTKEEFHYYFPD